MPRNQNKTAIITGIRGQDGSYLAELLHRKGYNIIGTSHSYSGYMDICNNNVAAKVISLNFEDTDSINAIIRKYKPDEIYNLAARSSSSQLFDDPVYTAEINGVAIARILEAIKKHSPDTRLCSASSSEVFAGTLMSPQNEHTPLSPVNSYGAAKTYGMNIITSYRSRYNTYACSAILYNHESPRRPTQYVTRKISQAAARISLGLDDALSLGNIDSRRDWGYAPDYVKAMWMMMQQDTPQDFVIATGESHSVREFLDVAFSHADLDWNEYVAIDPKYFRPTEVEFLQGDASRAQKILGWEPTIGFKELVRLMVDADIKALEEMKQCQDVIKKLTGRENSQ